MANIIQAAAAIKAARQLGVFSELQAGPVDPESLAQRLGLSPRGTRSLLTALVSLGLAELTPDGRYKSAVPDLVEMTDSLTALERLDEGIRADRRVADHDTVEGAERFYPWMVTHLARLQIDTAARAAAHLGQDGLKILDVGAGAAQWSLAMVEGYSDCTVTALDLPTVIPTTRAAVEAAGHQDCFEYLAGDMFEVDLPPATYDLVIIANVCHLFGDTTNRALLRRLYEPIRVEGNLAIIETIPDAELETSPTLALHDLGLVLRTREGKVHPFASYVSWLNSSGFVDVSRYKLESEPPVSLVSARRHRSST
jgi:2-polyprenyl-3-methyl-5-hydroxy-6-metoxy-1,4-benzoquinol methylase